MSMMLRALCFVTIFALYAVEAARTKQTARRLAATIPKLLPTAICDVDEAPETLKYYNEKCSNDTECFGGPNSMLCQNGVCQCAENFEPSQRFVGEKGTQTVCSSAPYLSSRCNATCQRPSTCLPYTGPGADGKVKVCQCAKPYVFQDGGCILQCPTDQFYDSTTYKCLPRCKANEILVNTTCNPLANLGDKCSSDKQCLQSFSACTKGICSCRDGFSTVQTSCVPTTVSCPVGDVLKDGKNFRECRTSSDLGDDKSTPRGAANIPPPPGARKLGDNCPKGSFCLVISSSYAQENGTGYCCPALNDNCPVGSPHPNAQCDSFGPNSVSCPWETHYCHTVSFGGSNSKQSCCPKVCSNDAVMVDKQCYPKVRVGDKCVKQEQCQSFLASCVNGMCQCDSGAKQAGSATYPYCTKDCQGDEVLRDKTCVKRLKLSDVCQKEKEYLCPENAYCNKNNQCACRCGHFTLADNTCAPPPVCRPPRPYPMFALGGRADSLSAGGPPPPPPVVRISDEERDKLLANVTFCTVRNKTAPNGVTVSQCPSNMYCSSYLTNLGLCCKIPEPQCFGGGKPQNDKQCDAKDPFSCGLDATCLKYVFAVDQDENSKVNTICCPKFSFEPVGAAPMALSAGPPPPAEV